MSASQCSKGRWWNHENKPEVAVKACYLRAPYESVVDYFSSEDGRVWSDKSGKWLRQSITANGYPVVGLSVGGRRARLFFVHRLVADAWLEADPTKPRVNHKDGNKKNNHVENLERCTSSENNKHALDTGLRVAKRGIATHSAKLTEEIVKACRQSTDRCSNLARCYDVNYKTMQSALNRTTWKHIP